MRNKAVYNNMKKSTLIISKMPIEIAKLIKFTDFTNFSGIPQFHTTFKGLKHNKLKEEV